MEGEVSSILTWSAMITNIIDFDKETVVPFTFSMEGLRKLSKMMAWTFYWGADKTEEERIDWYLSEERQQWLDMCSQEVRDWLVESQAPWEFDRDILERTIITP